ncbi:Serine/threonine-protein phosphatase 6 regulatory ankyrin repeat subunit A [Habropoda laboriosa]|uniref:Serine/threonine-protein phosphatase 6 regulatory ankyrin repeat subunit A n=1 Tax=Habropoda laboriosa TaxID=597456 RepID=A0A0L7RG68_9HYME|nr:Serine/threonine-protein phosphatase 6 regulatory ankyrin repeat subunit A [Habropoda laboriosa]
MNPRNDDHVKLITSIENNDAETAVKIVTERFDEKFLQPVGLLHVTAVQLAAWQGRIELLELFYKNGADISVTDKIGRCALFHAAHRGNYQVVQWLLEHGASVENRVGINACFKRISFSIFSSPLVGRDLPTPECWGRTPLHQAVKNNHSQVVKILVNAGADVNTQDEHGITPLLLAGSTVSPENPDEMCKFDEILEILVNATASTNVVHPDTGASRIIHG